jgi:hypothetical protein
MSGFLVAMLETGRGARTAADSVRPPFKQMTALTAGKYYRLKRLATGVSGYICDQCVTKCVAVLKQHGGFPPTVPSR